MNRYPFIYFGKSISAPRHGVSGFVKNNCDNVVACIETLFKISDGRGSHHPCLPLSVMLANARIQEK